MVTNRKGDRFLHPLGDQTTYHCKALATQLTENHLTINELTEGFEPPNKSFADSPLKPLGYVSMYGQFCQSLYGFSVSP